MKSLFIIILCIVTSKIFCQTSEVMVEEKSSEWIKVTSNTTVSKPKSTTTARKKTSSNKPSTLKKNTQEEFDKTNSQVKRFKKAKKG